MERLSPAKYGKSLKPPLSRFQVYALCEDGRIRGALKKNGRWKIPADATIKGRGKRTAHSPLKGLSVREYAEKYEISTARVYQLLKENKVRGAKKTAEGWDLPRTKAGRPPLRERRS